MKRRRVQKIIFLVNFIFLLNINVSFAELKSAYKINKKEKVEYVKGNNTLIGSLCNLN